MKIQLQFPNTALISSVIELPCLSVFFLNEMLDKDNTFINFAKSFNSIESMSILKFSDLRIYDDRVLVRFGNYEMRVIHHFDKERFGLTVNAILEFQKQLDNRQYCYVKKEKKDITIYDRLDEIPCIVNYTDILQIVGTEGHYYKVKVFNRSVDTEVFYILKKDVNIGAKV